MSEKAKFHKMTKPMKFRRLKQFKMMIVLWCKAVRERIIYLFNYILYKLHILKRYSYRDSVERVFSIPPNFNLKMEEVETKLFRGTVIMKIVQETFYDIDYFYQHKKDGSKKVTLMLKNTEENRLYLDSHLEDICLRINNTWYNTNSLPILKVAVLPPPTAFVEEDFSKSVECESVTYDLTPLKHLKHSMLLGKILFSDITEPELRGNYYWACEEFTEKLKSMTLRDLM